MALMGILGTIVIHLLLIQFLGMERKIWVNLGNLNLLNLQSLNQWKHILLGEKLLEIKGKTWKLIIAYACGGLLCVSFHHGLIALKRLLVKTIMMYYMYLI